MPRVWDVFSGNPGTRDVSAVMYLISVLSDRLACPYVSQERIMGN